MLKPLSIIIPCYNDAALIEQAVDSAFNQTYSNKEIIVIDDGSNEETRNVLKSIAHKIDKLITQENRGQSAARNRGIDTAKGNYILALDSDDYFEPQFCERAIQVFQQNVKVRLMSCHAMLHFNDGTDRVFIPSGGELDNFLFSNSALSVMFKKEDWLKVGGYDEKMRSGWEDWEFYIRLMQLGGRCEVIPEILFNYRKRKNTTTSRANANKKELWSYILLKHKALYISNYEGLVDFFLQRIEREEFEKVKNIQRIDFRIGRTLLRPLRLIKQKLF